MRHVVKRVIDFAQPMADAVLGMLNRGSDPASPAFSVIIIVIPRTPEAVLANNKLPVITDLSEEALRDAIVNCAEILSGSLSSLEAPGAEVIRH